MMGIALARPQASCSVHEAKKPNSTSHAQKGPNPYSTTPLLNKIQNCTTPVTLLQKGWIINHSVGLQGQIAKSTFQLRGQEILSLPLDGDSMCWGYVSIAAPTGHSVRMDSSVSFRIM